MSTSKFSALNCQISAINSKLQQERPENYVTNYGH